MAAAGAAAGLVHANVDVEEADQVGVQVRDRFLRFLREFTVEDVALASEVATNSQSHADVVVYVAQFKQMKNLDQTTLYVSFNHLLEFDEALGVAVADNFYRVGPYLRTSVAQFAGELDPDFAREKKEFFVSFHDVSGVRNVRDLKTDLIGKLVSIRGTVTRTSEVRPELLYGVFICQECGAPSGRVEQQFKYTEPTLCPNNCGNRTKWNLDVTQSKFVDWQRVRVQENSDEIPPGSMPRSLDVILRNTVVESAKAGDMCTFAGVMVVIPDVAQLMGRLKGVRRSAGAASAGEGVTGLKALGVRDLTYRTAFLASSVKTENTTVGANATDDQVVGSQAAAKAQEEEEAVVAMSRDPRLYENLIHSIAPTVHGHSEIKRGILLMLLGGLQKNTKDGIRLRGDINVCIVGDPATAKSQFLKYVAKFVPRSVYTSGKASSAAGLTASVAKDPDTGEFTIEAGALMLADNGICCIDEFDKMDPADQVAIHEAMEQQTISITKAGIQATLNARTSILAAANPIYGRYDKSKPLRHNITLSAAIMSRFDLFFVVLDELSSHVDEAIAKHIVDVHRRKAEALDPPYDMQSMQNYIKYARTVEPIMTADSKAAIVNAYQNLRKSDVVGSTQTAYRITVRQLESLIRLSEALARLHLDAEVKPEYVYEAFRLLKKSIIHVESAPVVLSMGDAEAPAADSGGGAATGTRVVMAQDKYRFISDTVVALVENAQAEGQEGLAQSDLVESYLDYVRLTDADERVEAGNIVREVVDRAITDGMLFVVENEAARGPDKEQRTLYAVDAS